METVEALQLARQPSSLDSSSSIEYCSSDDSDGLKKRVERAKKRRRCRLCPEPGSSNSSSEVPSDNQQQQVQTCVMNDDSAYVNSVA